MKFLLQRRDLSKASVSVYQPEKINFDLLQIRLADRLPKHTGYAIVETVSTTAKIIYRIGKQKKVPLLPIYYWSWLKRLRQDSDGRILSENWDAFNLESAQAYLKTLEAKRVEKAFQENVKKNFIPRVVFPYFNM